MKVAQTKTTYLEMLSPCMPAAALPAAYQPHEIAVKRLTSPTAEEYRRLYRGVGREYHWVDRLLMPESELLAVVQSDLVEILVLEVHGAPAGYAELDRRTPDQIELAYFGLFPEYVGRGLGKYLLLEALAAAWRHHPKRVWVHTCDLDHHAALGNYIKAGFTVYDEKMIDQAIPELPPGA